MAMAMAACSTRQRLSHVNPLGSRYFIHKLMFEIYDHFDGQDLIDVTFKLSNPNALVTAHRLVLSAACPYFKQLFKSEAGIRPLIEITEIDSDTFEHFIIFCYTGKILITIDNVDRMLKAALILQLDDVVTSCVDFLIDHITDYTLKRVYMLESETQCALLKEKLQKYEIGNFTDVIQSIEFLNFDATKLQMILQSDDLNVPTEADAFEAVKRWYEHDASARKQQLPDLISCLRLTQLDMNFIMTNIRPLPGCQLLALEILTWCNIPSTRGNISLKFTNPRMSELALMALNLKTYKSSKGKVFQYNETTDLWQKWIDIEMDTILYQVILVNDMLIFTGGQRNNKVTNEACSWSFKTKIFQQLPPMNEPRYRHCMAVLNNNLYAIGGYGANDDEVLRSVEMYSVSNGWKSIKSMITPRCSAGAVSLDGKVYVMGGDDGNYLKSVECYDPTTDCWTQCADMNELHSNHGVSVHNGQIFVVGGFGGNANTPIVERYDPQRNEWTKICSLSVGVIGIGCISFNKQLWTVGGYKDDDSDSEKDCVSVYDEQNDKWIDKAPIPSESGYYCFAVKKYLLLR